VEERSNLCKFFTPSPSASAGSSYFACYINYINNQEVGYILSSSSSIYYSFYLYDGGGGCRPILKSATQTSFIISGVPSETNWKGQKESPVPRTRTARQQSASVATVLRNALQLYNTSLAPCRKSSNLIDHPNHGWSQQLCMHACSVCARAPLNKLCESFSLAPK
jgi:hypothetical protein